MRTRVLALLIILSCLVLLSCKSAELKQDPYPATVDAEIYQTRLEFKGCGLESIVGSIVCFPNSSTVEVRTDFPGTLTLVSKGSGCFRQEEIKAVSPYTKVSLPSVDKICSTSILYQPKFVPEPEIPLRGIFGELVQFPDDSQVYLGTKAFTLYQPVVLPFPKKIVRGWYVNRYFDKPAQFQGSILKYEVPRLGTDLVQVKGFNAEGEPTFYLYTVNYYSPQAKPLTVSVDDKSKNKVQITVSEEVTVVTIGDQVEFWRSFKMDKSFVGIIRAYTVKGRTLVFKLNKGVIEWVQ